MCTNINRLYLKFAIAALISTVLGIVSGVVWPSFFTNPIRFLVIELITASAVLLTLAINFLAKSNRNNQTSVAFKYYARFQIFAAIGSFIISVLGVSTTLTTGLTGAIIIGIAVGFFTLLLFASVFSLYFLTSNNTQN